MTQEENTPLIVGFVADLMFHVQIAQVIKRLGYRVHWIERAEEVAPADPDAPTHRPGEALFGQGGALFKKLTEWQPALLIFDLNNDAIPWQKWIATLKSSPATRRIPVLCFGSHVDVETMQAAREAGADEVVARSRFSSALPQLVEKHARVADREGLAEACNEPLPALVVRGIEKFNEGQYYECHDDLEEAWMADEGPGRDLYRGILQVGIAYFQIERGNYRGAVKMLLRVRQWLTPLPAVCRGVDVARLREDVNNVHTALAELGPERMDDLDRSLFRPVRYNLS